MTQLSTQLANDMKRPTQGHSPPAVPAEDDNWEDVTENESWSEEQDEAKVKSRPSTPLASPTPRRRKLHKATYVASSNRKGVVVAPPTPKRKAAPRREIPTDQIIDTAVTGAVFTGHYVLDIFGTGMNLMRKPLGFLVFVVLLSVCMGYVAFYVQKALLPFCFLPFVNRSAMCAVLLPPPTDTPNPWEKLIQVQTKTFDELLDETAGGSSLSLEVKKAEMATADLVTLVRHSDLKTRDMLAASLKGFVEDARKTGRGLQKMSAKVAGAVDNILAVNTYAMRMIEASANKKPSVFDTLMPWSSKSTEDVVTKTFADAMGVLSANLARLVLEAENNLANLNSLEEHLSTLHDMVTRENITTVNARDDLLSDLWTVFGGNRKELRNFEEHLTLLKEAGSFRKKALIHVTAALETLRAMSDDMEDLRERAASPELIGPSLPMAVHIESIQNGITRLQEGRDRAKRVEADTVRRVLQVRPEDDE